MYRPSKNLLSLPSGETSLVSALQSHWIALMEIAASKVPARKGMPCPMSASSMSPSTSLSSASASMELEISIPNQA